jgi:hypothetical protein
MQAFTLGTTPVRLGPPSLVGIPRTLRSAQVSSAKYTPVFDATLFLSSCLTPLFFMQLSSAPPARSLGSTTSKCWTSTLPRGRSLSRSRTCSAPLEHKCRRLSHLRLRPRHLRLRHSFLRGTPAHRIASRTPRSTSARSRGPREGGAVGVVRSLCVYDVRSSVCSNDVS